jgi:hypothetical protein
MKNFILFGFALAMIVGNWSCNGQTIKEENKTNTSVEIEAYYFHFSARCVTCKTVEAEAKADIESLYNGKVKFQAVNLDDASSKALADKFQVASQTLLIVKGNTKINITNEGFLYAVSNPEKFKSIIKETVDPLIN